MFKSQFLVFLCLSLTSLVAPAAERSVGKVLPISDRVLLRVGNRIVGDVYSIAWPTTVTTTDGLWLWVEDDGGSGPTFVGGWLRTDDVIPLVKALEYFNARLLADPPSASSYWLRGVCWEQASEFNLAAKDYDAALRLDPLNRAARLGLARALALRHEYDEQEFQAAWQANRSAPRALVDWGAALVLANQKDRAAIMYQQAARLNPNWYMPYYALGKLAAEQKDYVVALNHYAEALRRDPAFHAVHRDRALAWLAFRDSTFEELQKILSDPDPATRWLTEHQPDELVISALSEARKACELSSYRESESLAALAQAFAALGRWPEARRFAQMAVEYAPFHAKQKQIARYDAYNRLLSGEQMLAQTETAPPNLQETAIGEPATAAGRATMRPVRPSMKAGESRIQEAAPQPYVRPAKRPRFVDRSAMRFE